MPEHGTRSEAAIASERAASLYGLTVIAADVGDHPEAYTRFVSVSTYTRLDEADGQPPGQKGVYRVEYYILKVIA